MVDWWKRYGIFVAKKHDPKWSKIMLKIKKYKMDFEKCELEIKKEMMRNKMKKLLISKINKQLKRTKPLKQTKSPIKSKPNKIYKKLQKSLKLTLKEQKNTSNKLKKLSNVHAIKLNQRSKSKSKPYSIRATNAKHWRHKAWRDSFIRELQHALDYELKPQRYEESTKQLLAKIQKDEETLDRINSKIIKAINDIREMDEVLDYIRNSDHDNLKLKPFIDYFEWKQPPKRHEASVIMNKVKMTKNIKHVHQDVLNFQRDYILEHIPELQPPMFSYLQNTKISTGRTGKKTF